MQRERWKFSSTEVTIETEDLDPHIVPIGESSRPTMRYQPARVDRGSSRRKVVLREPAYISLIHRRHTRTRSSVSVLK